jgi:hypothetical protein
MTTYNKINSMQQQVNDVILIMKDNLDKTLERDEKIDNIENKTEELQDNSKRFEKVSIKLKQKMMWKNIKFILVLAIILLMFIIIVILASLKK